MYISIKSYTTFGTGIVYLTLLVDREGGKTKSFEMLLDTVVLHSGLWIGRGGDIYIFIYFRLGVPQTSVSSTA